MILRLSPHAKVRRKASAKSGERMPRFFMSALLSTAILPVEVKLYVSPLRLLGGLLHAFALVAFGTQAKSIVYALDGVGSRVTVASRRMHMKR